MNISIQRSIVVIFLILFVLFGCSGCDELFYIENREYPEGTIEEFIWDTAGGGDIRFIIEHDDNNFKIAVERYKFNPLDIVFKLTDADYEVYGLVKDIFNEVININDYTFTPVGMTGTWTTITLIFSGNQEHIIENIRNDAFIILSAFVNKNTELAL